MLTVPTHSITCIYLQHCIFLKPKQLLPVCRSISQINQPSLSLGRKGRGPPGLPSFLPPSPAQGCSCPPSFHLGRKAERSLGLSHLPPPSLTVVRGPPVSPHPLPFSFPTTRSRAATAALVHARVYGPASTPRPLLARFKITTSNFFATTTALLGF